MRNLRFTLLSLCTTGITLLLNSGGRGGTPAAAGKLTPAQSAAAFTVPEDLRWQQVLAEPEVRQPVSMQFDERGRLWVVEYLQYPHPAGLKLLSKDAYWRAVYDKVPPPPPRHFPGKDRVSIHEDTDGDGVYDKHSVFVDGLNIVTAALPGHGGVWILNPPYLLFYPTGPDRDRPSGDPVVHLQGFGLEDTHSVASSLRWGPDGWLYGAHGSTVSSRITRPESKNPPIAMIGQHIWRYHPDKHRFETFAEGGGNAFGVEIDRQGRLFSGHNGGATRGFHYVQGGYYLKGFEKHGVLSNPYAFGYFPAMKSPAVPRFTHAFVLNESPALPERYRGQLFAVAPLQSQITLSEVLPEGSTVRTRDLAPVVTGRDPWFRPVDIKVGPGGDIFVADFYEARIDHLTHHAGSIDRDSGRIYRLTARDAKPRKLEDLGRKSTAELIALLTNDDRWARQMALRLLGDRRDASAVPALRQMLADGRGQSALEALWALHLSGGFDENAALKAVDHPEPAVRAWAVRLRADDFALGAALTARVAERARKEEDVAVRSQWAASARRLPAAEAFPILRSLLAHDEDVADPHLPLLLWWALETQCGKDPAGVVELLRDSTLWRARLVEETILPRLMRRFALAGALKDFGVCTELFRLAPEARFGKRLLEGFEEAFKGRSSAGLPAELLAEVDKLGGGSVAFGVRQGRAEAIDKTLAALNNPKAAAPLRLEMVQIFGEAPQSAALEPLLALARGEDAVLSRAALAALQSYQDDRVGAEVVRLYPLLKGAGREAAEELLASRKTWSARWLEAVDAGQIEPRAIPLPTVRKLLLLRDPGLAALVRKHWGEVRGATTAEMGKEIYRLHVVAEAAGGDPYAGKILYTARCATCHTLHAKGGAVGPDLTPFQRDDLRRLLVSIVNPSAEIREGFENHIVVTESGRTLTGILLEKDAKVVVLRASDGQRVVLPREDVAEMTVSGASLMPEGLLQGLTDTEVRDLFAYLRTSQPLNERAGGANPIQKK